MALIRPATAQPQTGGGQLALAIDRPEDAAPFDAAGDAFCARFSPAERRPWGLTLTPEWLVAEMIDMATALGEFGRVVDAQEAPPVIIWGHRLDDLKTLIEASR